MKINIYMAAFKFRAATAIVESFLIREIPTHLTKEIVIRCSNVISEDRA